MRVLKKGEGNICRFVMAIDSKKLIKTILIPLVIVLLLFCAFVKLAADPFYSTYIIIIFVIIVFTCLIFAFLSDDDERLKFHYNISLILAVLIPALMFFASIVQKNHLIKFLD